MIHLDMGKYAMFVWPVYAISAAVMGWMVADSLGRARRWRREVERLGSGKDRA